MTHDEANRYLLPRREFLWRSGAAAGTFMSLGTAFSRAAHQAPPDGAQSPLIVHSEQPPNAEPRLDQLVRDWITPVERFYIRSHAPSPVLDPQTFELSIEGLVRRPLKIKLAQLRHDFSNRSVIATLTCAGNRREEHSRIQPVAGVPWGAGAIGNARWRGVPVAELLRAAGVREGAQHVWFEGADQVQREPGVISFGGSIPLDKAMRTSDRMPGALIVHQMNGQPLTADHGFPIRSVVPGYIGARSVKWLRRIVVSDRPSGNHYMARAYKVVTADADAQWRQAEAIGTFPINAVLAVPSRESSLTAGRVELQGYALPRGEPGRTITQVEVSSDGGNQWSHAGFTEPARPFCWRLWSATVNLPAGTHEIVIRATDSSGHVQPQRVAWNLKGYLFNAWHRTTISVGT